MDGSQQSDYDLFEYVSQPYADSRPENCALIARLRGFTPPELSAYRCLEIGCASGNNILPLACQNPAAQFVGFDASHLSIERAESLQSKLGLTNIKFHVARFEELDSVIGEFDYIICHGVLSWIQKDLQTKLFSFCNARLLHGGVLYLSYNTYPGWHIRELVRNALLFHTSELPPSEAKVDQARQFASFLSQYISSAEFTDAALVKNEFLKASQLPGWYLLHDLLEGENNPLYFSDVVNACDKVGLAYVGDAELGMMFPQEFSAEVKKKLYTLGSSPEMLEQYLDLFRLRSFRKSIFVKGIHSAPEQLDVEAVSDLFVATNYKKSADSTRFSTTPKVYYQNSNGDNFRTSDPVISAILEVLIDISPQRVVVTNLVAGIVERQSAPELDIKKTILKLYLEGIVELSMTPLLAITTVQARPKASSLARIQAAESDAATNLKHELVELDDLSRNILLLADGTRTLAEIEVELNNRGVRALRDGVKIPLSEAVKITLHSLARECLLEG